LRGVDAHLSLAGLRHCLNGISQQIHQHLLRLYAITHDERHIVGERDRYRGD